MKRPSRHLLPDFNADRGIPKKGTRTKKLSFTENRSQVPTAMTPPKVPIRRKSPDVQLDYATED